MKYSGTSAAPHLLLARRYLDAARQMRVKQLVYRGRRLLPMRALAAGTGSRRESPPHWQPLALGTGVEAAPSSGPRRPPHEDGLFRAFGLERSADDLELWSDRGGDLLFLFHLHGFQDLAECALPAADAGAGNDFWTDLVSRWLDQCGDPTLPAWHPYPTSGRIIAWCAALSRDGFLNEIREPMLISLWRQLRTLRRSIEHDIGGNHVIRNAAALIIGGLCLENLPVSRRGVRLLEAELARQILSDGGHEERSPCYHRIVLGDLHDVANVLGRSSDNGLPAWLTGSIERMESWLGSMTGPAGEVAPLNDGWDGPPIRLPPERPDVELLMPSGYLALGDGTTRALLDMAPVSPPHLPAHAHADVFSLVLWAAGDPILIDPGSGAYSGPQRNEFRGTAAHSTVQVDGQDQCDLWGTFRAAGLPRVTLTAVDPRQDGVVVVRAHHDGYRRLSDPVVHERTFIWLGADGIAVLDRLLCQQIHSVVSRLHFADRIRAPLGEDLPGGLRFAPLGISAAWRERPGRRSPSIGQTVPILVGESPIRVRPRERFGWMLVREGVALELRGSKLEVVRPGKMALQIDLPEDSPNR